MQRSEIIDLARSLILQGNIDPLWTAAEWDVCFNEAVNMLHEAFVDSDSGYFIKRDFAITLTNGRGTLPADFFSMVFVSDDQGAINALDRDDDHLNSVSGFVLEEDEIVLRNWDVYPATITCDYYRLPKEIPAWDGSVDPSSSIYTPDPVFATARGGRTIARIIQILAQIKDGTNTDAAHGHAQSVADRFVDRFLSRKESQ